MAGVLGVVATVAAVRDGRVTSVLVGAAILAGVWAITRRNIFGTYRAGQNSRDREGVIDLNEKRRLSAVPDRRKGSGF